ncbi:DUF3732 domain-containing protein [Chloroflexota bacterium]
MLEGPTVDIPEHIESKNVTVDAVKNSLNEIGGLTALNFDPEDTGSSFKGRPSFRDLGAFTFQPQNVVANSDVLFFKTESYEHREKLRTIFPYVLNAITPEQMAKRHELDNLKKELRRKENELATVRQVSERWMGEIQARASEAKELGFIQQSIRPEATREELVDLLTQVVSSSSDVVRVTEQTISEAIKELIELQKEESAVSMELSHLRKRYSEMSTLRESTIQYRDALVVQKDRLDISKWIGSQHKENRECPLCGNSIIESTRNLHALEHALDEIEEEAGRFETIPAAFDREFERVKSEIRTISEKLRGTQIRRENLEQRSDEAKQTQYDSLRASRFIGNFEQSLHTYTRIGTDSELENEVRELQESINSLNKDISEEEVNNRTRRALNVVRSNAEKLLPFLDVERPDDPISLSINDLTIKVGGVERDDYLWELGSGSNWLSYHVAVTLGLQQFFLSLSHSPVPSFIVYDQPSQVYFPKRLPIKEDEVDFGDQYTDEDITAVQKIFSVFTSVINGTNGAFQIIVLDHAAEDVWGIIEGIHLVEEWRNGLKLVPISWLS